MTSDHGELFGEQGTLAHQIVVHEAVFRVPLVIYGIDGLSTSTGETVQHVDVIRTILELVGGPTDGLQGRDLLRETRDWAIVQRGGERTRLNLDKIREYNSAFDSSRYH